MRGKVSTVDHSNVTFGDDAVVFLLLDSFGAFLILALNRLYKMDISMLTTVVDGVEEILHDQAWASIWFDHRAAE